MIELIASVRDSYIIFKSKDKMMSYIAVHTICLLMLPLNFVSSDYELAHSKLARQSSTYNNGEASMAVDGDPATYSFAYVGGQSSDIGWWQVDLEKIYKITRITIINSLEIHAYKGLSNYIVFTGATNATEYNLWEGGVECYMNTSDTPVSQGGEISFNCSQQPAPGRYVTIRRNQGGIQRDMISLGEVRVYTNETVYRLDYLKYATQSHTYNNNDARFIASAAVDGRLYTCSFTAIGSSTDVGWWQVDLGDVYAVTGFEITNWANKDIESTKGEVNKYMTNFAVFVDFTNSTGDSLSSDKLCLQYSNNGILVPSEQPISGDCSSGPMHGRFVIIRKQGSDRPDALVLCEVYIYGYKENPSTRTTSSSSVKTTLSKLTPTPVLSTLSPETMTSSHQAIVETSSSSSHETWFASSTNNSSISKTDASKLNDSERNAIIIGVVVCFVGLVLVIILVACLVKRCCRTRTPENKQLHSNLSYTAMQDIQSSEQSIKITDLNAFIEYTKAKGGGFDTEFKKLPTDDNENATIAKSHPKKNRFQNVLPYDNNLVPLFVEEDGDVDENYINASFITGYKDKPKIYIATQGPKATTVNDFWRMVWQQHIENIVMITPLIENAKKKCEQYWPENLHGTCTYQHISVNLAVEETYADYVYRQFVVHDTRHTDEPMRIVRHMHFSSWDDKSRPEHCFPLLAFRRRAKVLQSMSTGPNLVHCSAGVGRTGTYIAIDYLLDQIAQEDEISVFKCVEALRHQRMTMVQTVAQYEFVYESVLEGATFGDSGMKCADFTHRYSEFSQATKIGSPSALEEQFQLLNSQRETKAERKSAGLENKNLAMNRDRKIVAYDDCRPYLMSSDHKSIYINATNVDGYRSKNAYLLTQVPLSKTIEDFWTLVWIYRLETIVLLEEIEETDNNLPVYWPNGDACETYGQCELKLVSAKEDPSSHVWERQFSVTNSTDTNADPLTVTQYRLPTGTWKNEIPSQTTSVLRLARLLAKCRGKVILQCADGASRSGLIAAALHIIDMMKVEQIVDVFLVCRYVIINRPQAIVDLSQYKFLHELALDCIKEHDEYDEIQPSNIYVNLPAK